MMTLNTIYPPAVWTCLTIATTITMTIATPTAKAGAGITPTTCMADSRRRCWACCYSDVNFGGRNHWTRLCSDSSHFGLISGKNECQAFHAVSSETSASSFLSKSTRTGEALLLHLRVAPKLIFLPLKDESRTFHHSTRERASYLNHSRTAGWNNTSSRDIISQSKCQLRQWSDIFLFFRRDFPHRLTLTQLSQHPVLNFLFRTSRRDWVICVG